MLDHVTVIDTLSSATGGRQGDVLASLLCARLFQDVYEACLDSLPSLTGRAIMDDFSFAGTPDDVFTAIDRFRTLAAERHVTMSNKSVIQQPHGEPLPATLEAANARGLKIVRGNCELLGAAIGPDDGSLTDWLRESLALESPISRAICDPDLPPLLALRLDRTCHLPRPSYLMRALPLRVTTDLLTDFDTTLRCALCARLDLPDPLPTSAQISIEQPSRNGGLGLTPLRFVLRAARWASAAAPLQTSRRSDHPTLPFVGDRAQCHSLLVTHGVAISAPDTASTPHSSTTASASTALLPSDPAAIHTFYGGNAHLPGLQCRITLRIFDTLLERFLAGPDSTPGDRTRLTALKRSKDQRTVGAWLSATFSSLMSTTHTAIAVRLHTGLPPLPASCLPTCCALCGTNIADDPWHALSCVKLRRLAVTTRHDAVVHFLTRYASATPASHDS